MDEKSIMIRYANDKDIDVLVKYDKHIARNELINIIALKRVIIIKDKEFIGWLRYNLFWDNTPFMNMLYILAPFRNKGYGALLVKFFEEEMKKNYNIVLTSTQDNESAKYFYRYLGYKDIGSFKIPSEEKELILFKEL